jgi:hypothetical protein
MTAATVADSSATDTMEGAAATLTDHGVSSPTSSLRRASVPVGIEGNNSAENHHVHFAENLPAYRHSPKRPAEGQDSVLLEDQTVTLPFAGTAHSFVSLSTDHPVVTAGGVEEGSFHKDTNAIVHKAMEEAASLERRRIHQLEQEEQELQSAEEFRRLLKQERHRSIQLQMDLAAAKQHLKQLAQSQEIQQEGRINQLVNRVDQIQQEKERLLVDLQREEEMVSFLNGFYQAFNATKAESYYYLAIDCCDVLSS